MGSKLSEREHAFIRGVARGETGVDAARAAGYRGSPTVLAVRAHKLLGRPRVQDELARIRAAATTVTVLELQARLEMLSSIGRGDPVTHVLKDGSSVEAPASARDRIAAIAEIGKLKGDYTKKVEVVGAFTLVALIDQLDAQRTALAGP